eukprot:1157286-Pelagomonas_calceolata.AAC.2
MNKIIKKFVAGHLGCALSGFHAACACALLCLVHTLSKKMGLRSTSHSYTVKAKLLDSYEPGHATPSWTQASFHTIPYLSTWVPHSPPGGPPSPSPSFHVPPRPRSGQEPMTIDISTFTTYTSTLTFYKRLCHIAPSWMPQCPQCPPNDPPLHPVGSAQRARRAACEAPHWTHPCTRS